MDKYEYRVKTEQMLDYMEKKQYKKAMEIADTIDWRRVKNSTMLSTVSEIYECNGENQKSRDILFIAYDRAPESRKVVYRLGTLAVKLNDLQEANDCYEEFVKLAPKDPNRYILKYKILKAQNAPFEKQIEPLKEFKQVEYVEKWGYELAKLYHDAGMIQECIEECDDLILWFSEGKYVMEAMKLKMIHKPLTPLQQEKYNSCLKGEVHVSVEKEQEQETEAEAEVETETEEIAEEPKEDLGATRVFRMPNESKEASDEKDSKEDDSSEEMEEVLEDVQEEEIEEEPKEVYGAHSKIIQTTVAGATLAEAVAKGMAAATGREIPVGEPEIDLSRFDRPEIEIPKKEEEKPVETAHEKIEGILQDWEEKQKAVEQEIAAKKQQAEEEKEKLKLGEKKRENMFNTAPIIPDDIQKLLNDLENGVLENDIPEEETEEVVEDVVLEEDFVEEEFDEEDLDEEEFDEEDLDEEEFDEEDLDEEEFDEEEFDEEDLDEEEFDEIADDEDFVEEEFDIPEEEEEEFEEVAEEEPEPEKEKTALEELEEQIEEEKNNVSPGGVSFDTGFVVQGRYDLEAQSEIGLKAGLTEEQKKLFSYFVPVRGMSEQLVEVLEKDKNCNSRYGTSRTGNILIVGRRGTGKTVLAVNVVKAIQKERKLKQGKVAIVTGDALNKKELTSVLSKLKGGALIIEKAGKLNSRTIRELNDLMEEQTGELLFVLEEQRKPLEKLLSANPEFRRKFTSKLELPIFINDELVTFGQTYAKENGYRIDDMGILALYSRIDIMQKEDHAVTVAEVKDIIDEAIDNAQKANVKHFMKRMFGKHTDNSDRVILTEQDFK